MVDGLHLPGHAARRLPGRLCGGVAQQVPGRVVACSCPAGSALIRYCTRDIQDAAPGFHNRSCCITRGIAPSRCAVACPLVRVVDRHQEERVRVTRSSPGPCNSFTIFPSNASADTRCLWKHNARRAHFKFAK